MRKNHEVFHSPSGRDITHYHADDPVFATGWYWWFSDERVPHGPYDTEEQARWAAEGWEGYEDEPWDSRR